MADGNKILIRALVSEKATELQEKKNCYVFRVAPEANKMEIKTAIEKSFNVKVASVTTTSVHGKTKKLGRFIGKRSSWKKALIRLKEGEKIELFEGA
jgi:large subunit ribosomal protein L23